MVNDDLYMLAAFSKKILVVGFVVAFILRDKRMTAAIMVMDLTELFSICYVIRSWHL